MKKLCLTLAAFAALPSLFAQVRWDTVSSGTNKDLYSISFADEQTGYISGEAGLLLKTTDSGKTWNPLSPSGLGSNNSGNDIIDIAFVDAQHGYAILNNFPVQEFSGKLYQTSDGGQTWTAANDSIAIAASRCYFFEEGNGFLLGAAFFAGNVIGKMESGLWTQYFNFSFTPSSFNYGLDFLNPLIGIAGGDGGYFYRTFDGGQSWDSVYSGNDSTIYAIKYLDDNNIIAATGNGNRSLIISHDGGASWEVEVNSFTFAYPIMKSLAINAGDSIIAAGHTTNSEIVGSGMNGFVYWNSGDGWQQQFFSRALYDVSRQSDAAAFAVGGGGIIITNKPQPPASIAGESYIADKLKVFPNPSTGRIQLQYSGLHFQSLQLYDLRGRKIKDFPPQSKTLNISSLVPGVYFLKVKAPEGETRKRISIIPR